MVSILNFARREDDFVLVMMEDALSPTAWSKSLAICIFFGSLISSILDGRKSLECNPLVEQLYNFITYTLRLEENAIWVRPPPSDNKEKIY
mmetsp:Transcript_36261/g.58221  ORF Transcript_36261/g.58221 Transcript_36261/m.58221 type:complete len:91 (-) Transcript_36261:37-309(-)